MVAYLFDYILIVLIGFMLIVRFFLASSPPPVAWPHRHQQHRRRLVGKQMQRFCQQCSRSQKRVMISNLLPCTKYSFRIVSYTEAGDLGHSEAKCFTKSVEIIQKNPNSVAVNHKMENCQVGGSSIANTEHKTAADVESDSGFKVRDLGKILRLAWAQERGCLDGFCGVSIGKCCGVGKEVKPECIQEDQLQSVSRELDLNVASVPDLNEELIPPFESSRDEDNGCAFGRAVELDDDVASLDNQRNGAAYSTVLYRALLKITEGDFSGLPITVIGELLSGLILCMWAALTVSGKFLSILPDSDENRY